MPQYNESALIMAIMEWNGTSCAKYTRAFGMQTSMTCTENYMQIRPSVYP